MGHDVHFLERLSRVESGQASRALALYRDPELVRELLHDQKVPESAERVAIALEDGERSPHLIVARDGHFVTCLGPGMKVGPHPVLSRKKLESALVRVTRMRDADAAFQKLEAKSSRSLAILCKKVVESGNHLSREDFVALAAMQPLIGASFLRFALEDAKLYLERSVLQAIDERPPERRADELERVWNLYWSWHHWMLLGAGGPLPDAVSDAAVKSLVAQFRIAAAEAPLVGGWVRALWAIGRFGADALGHLKEQHRTVADLPTRVYLATALTELGLGHAKLRGEIRKYLERARVPEVEAVSPEARAKQQVLEDQGNEVLIRLLDTSDPTASEFGEALRALAAEDEVEHSQVMPLIANSGAFIFTSEDWFTIALIALPRIPRVAAEELFFPAAEVDVTPAFSPEQMLKLLRSASSARYREAHPQMPVRAGPKVGRNEPCPCGSGKKAKRCCAA